MIEVKYDIDGLIVHLRSVLDWRGVFWSSFLPFPMTVMGTFRVAFSWRTLRVLESARPGVLVEMPLSVSRSRPAGRALSILQLLDVFNRDPNFAFNTNHDAVT